MSRSYRDYLYSRIYGEKKRREDKGRQVRFIHKRAGAEVPRAGLKKPGARDLEDSPAHRLLGLLRLPRWAGRVISTWVEAAMLTNRMFDHHAWCNHSHGRAWAYNRIGRCKLHLFYHYIVKFCESTDLQEQSRGSGVLAFWCSGDHKAVNPII